MGYINNRENKLHYAYSVQRWKTHSHHLQQLFEVSAVLETFCQSLSTSNTNVVVHKTACEQQYIHVLVSQSYFRIFCMCLLYVKIKITKKFEHSNISQC